LLKNYTVNFYVLRSRDVPPDLLVKVTNASPLLIIPGPKDPKHWDVFNALVLEVFVALGIHSGAQLTRLFS
jgi:hypothetical protein